VHAQALAAWFGREGADRFEAVENLPEWVEALVRGESVRLRPPPTEQRAAAREKRRFERLERAAGGFDDLDAWLSDTVRRGLATVVSEEPEAFVHLAARLADASLTGLSRLARRLQAVVEAAAPGWEETVVTGLADAYLALRAFRRRDRLDAALLYDLQQYAGLTARKDTVWQHGERVADVWAVLGQSIEIVEEKLQARRTWLYGGRSARYALLLDYAFADPRGNSGFAPGLNPGSVVEAGLAFYPSAWPLRALAPDDLIVLVKKVEKMPGWADFQSFTETFSQALGRLPWLGPFPAAFPAVTPHHRQGRFFILDATGRTLPVAAKGLTGWKLLALSGGLPIGVFGEWNGEGMVPAAVVAEGRFVAL
jgi:hypothetical protein